jgi:Reverse transcriptase (RNA-dependent DNA polymerase)
MRHFFAGPLAKIFEKLLTRGWVPNDWKTASVVPIYKKGAKGDPGNYRPVSLTSVPCKVMESIIKDEMMTFLESNDLISDSQHGFRSGRSCTTNLLTFQEEITLSIDAGVPIDVFYLDFAKAFD